MPAKKKPSAKKAEPASQPESKLPAWAGKLPLILIAVGALLAILGIATNAVHFTHAWLVSFMFYLSICLGGFFLVLLHYLLDTHWIVPIRRIAEHLSCILPLLVVFFIPIAIWSGAEFVTISDGAATHGEEQVAKAEKAGEKAANAHGEKVEAKADGHGDKGGKRAFYSWMQSEKEHNNPHETHDHAWYAKKGYLNSGFWHLRWVACFVLWGVLTWLIRKHSLAQDADGAAKWTGYNRKLAAGGIFVFAATLTIGAVDWMKG
ncbi:MAG: hypothetical protein VX704_01235, partial [Verrucomicrobiota bacterium]|nr:hypothetical protein [Verrucomicrobiota bacterium]